MVLASIFGNFKAMRPFFLMLMMLSGAAIAQTPDLPFRRIGYEQGLSNSTIECIFQDHRGFIWLGTRDGLDRYDGNEITVYRNNPSDTGSLSDNFIRCIIEDSSGALWIGTSNGLNRMSGGRFTRYYHLGAVSSLCFDGEGRLWVGTDGAGLEGFSPQGFTRYEGPGDHVNALTAVGGILWVGTEQGLSRFDPSSRRLSAVGHLPPVQVIRPDASGDLWIGTEENGVFVYHPGGAEGAGGAFIAYRHADRDPSSLAGNMVKSILTERKGRTWVGCINGGLNLFEPAKGTFAHYQNDPLDPSSLSQRTVSALFEDNQGNLWVGTHRGGLNLYMPGAVKFGRYPQPGAGGLTNRDVRAFFEDASGKIWIGTDGGGLNIWDPKTNRWSAYRYDPFRPGSLGSDAVLDIMQDSRGDRWISTWEGGLNRWNRATGTFTRYLHGGVGSIGSNYVQKTFEDRRGRLWVATYFGGLDLLDPVRGTFRRVVSLDSGETSLRGNNIVSINEDSQGNIWAGTDDGGLNRCDLRTGRFTHYFTKECRNPDIRVIFTDHRGRLWIGQSGLYLYDPVKDTFTVYTERGGLSHEFIKGITEDALGNFWIATGGGLMCFNPETYACTRYNRGDGLQGLEFEAGACLETHSGEMLFGGTDGFNIFYPRDIQRNPFIPPVYITGFQVFGHGVPLTDTLQLSFRQSTFSFAFTALNYSVPENNQYAYMLEPFDKEWHYVGNEHKASYTNIDPGVYTFRVKASNNDGVWNDQGAWVRVVIAPPFWKTGWFVALVVIAVTGGAYGFYRFKRNLEVARLEERKRDEIHQVQLQFFTNISHELRTPLTLILGQLEKLFKTDASPALKSIYRNAGRLMSLINELMDFRKLETGALTLHVMPGHLSLFLEEIAGEFEDWASEKHIRFGMLSDIPSGPVWFDRQVLEKIVLNLLHNAFKYTESGGTITLTASLTAFMPGHSNELKVPHEYRAGGYVHIRVADTGIGISKESISHLFERYYRISESHLGSGVGLAFVRNLTQLHKGDITVYSQRNEGTEIIVSIPYAEADYAPGERWVAGSSPGRVQLESIRTPEGPLSVAPAGGVAASEAPLLLIVEDNDELRAFLADTFRPVYRVAEAVDGEKGWESVRDAGPDLIISDVMMPGMSGVELCRLVKQDLGTSHIPFLMLTAKDAGAARLEGVESGADYYFTKPVSMDLLLATIHNIFERQQKLKAHFQENYQVEARELVHSRKDKTFMDALLATIDAQIVNPDLDVDFLCGQLGMSRTKLYQKIKQITGQSIGEFVRTIRLKKAVHILLHEDVPFTDVMYRIGIQSQSYFTKAFKKEFGKTPTQFLQDAKRPGKS